MRAQAFSLFGDALIVSCAHAMRLPATVAWRSQGNVYAMLSCMVRARAFPNFCHDGEMGARAGLLPLRGCAMLACMVRC